MDLELTADQQALLESVRDVLSTECPPALARAVHEGSGSSAALWRRMVELGWPALTLPEHVGGLGLGAVELAVVSEQLGRRVSPGPFLATVGLFAAVVRSAGTPEQQDTFLRPVAEEGRTGTVAVAEHPARWAPGDITASVGAEGDGYRVRATKHQVLDGASAQEIAVVARDGADVVVVVVPAADVTATAVRTPDPTRPWAGVTIDTVVPADRVLRPDGDAVGTALQEATVALAAETVGACQAALDLTLEHVRTREQFGVPVGSFQAVKHRAVDMHVAVERARATVYFAALAVAEDDPRRALAAHMAKAAADDCAAIVGQESIQLHGGVGYTWEHDLHLYVKRAKSAEAMLGGARWHRQRVADLVGLAR